MTFDLSPISISWSHLVECLQDLGPEGDGGTHQRQQPEDQQNSGRLNPFHPLVLDQHCSQ